MLTKVCSKCNAVLGMCNDNLDILKNSIKYLQENKNGMA